MSSILINGLEQTTIDVKDRGFQYGDGIFETIAWKNNKLQFWDAHLARMQNACERLHLNSVDEALWLSDIKALQLSNDAVVKLMISRGVSGRGYVYTEGDSVTRVTVTYPMPDYPQGNSQGVKTVLCKTPVSINPVLAGIKHLNRLDNVLARNEWQDSNIAEGFMFDHNEHIIEGTMSNVFCVLGDELYTPALDLCGVAGVMRQQVIEVARTLKLPVNIVDISKQNFLQMDGVFITNSLIGIWPVAELESVKFQSNKLIERLQNELAKFC